MRHRSVPEGEYLALLSTKHSIDPEQLFKALATTKEQKTTRCGTFSIQCRGKSRDSKIFLITNDSRVIAQVRIADHFLAERTNPITRFKDCERIQRYLARKNALANVGETRKISDLRVGMSKFNLNGRVLKVYKPNQILTRTGNFGVVASALIGDGTGTIMLSLWGEQIQSVSVGNMVQITNARVFQFRGEKQLRVGRKGVLKVKEEPAISDCAR